MEASVECPRGGASGFMDFVVSSGVCAEDTDLGTGVLGIMKHYPGRKCRVRRTKMESQEGKKVDLPTRVTVTMAGHVLRHPWLLTGHSCQRAAPRGRVSGNAWRRC